MIVIKLHAALSSFSHVIFFHTIAFFLDLFTGHRKLDVVNLLRFDVIRAWHVYYQLKRVSFQ